MDFYLIMFVTTAAQASDLQPFKLKQNNDLNVLVNKKLLDQLQKEQQQVSEAIGPELAIQQERIDELEREIHTIGKQLNSIQNPYKMALKTSLSSIGTFLGLYGYHIGAALIKGGLTVSALVLGLTNPVGWGCALGFAIVVGGVVLFHVYFQQKQYSKMLDSLKQAHLRHLQDLQDIKIKMKQQTAIFNAKMNEQSRRIDSISQHTDETINRLTATLKQQEEISQQTDETINRLTATLKQQEEKWRQRFDVQDKKYQEIINIVEQKWQTQFQQSQQRFEQQKNQLIEESEKEKSRLLNVVEVLQDSTEKCGICMDRDWDVCLKPCNHALCKECADKCYAREMCCPACRKTILAFQPVYKV